MGQGLPKAVTSVVLKRNGGKLFRVGFAEMNGWRASMEDAHVMFERDSWGFFGVFDGHGGDLCSKYVAKRYYEELEKGRPTDDAALKSLALGIDREFLESGQASGSTGTFVLIEPPSGDEAQYLLRVGNIGDSRVLLGRADGSIVEGPGTDGGLTTDHKPDYPSERERIERTGGHVQLVQGVPRVNGDLAVSRSFGDRQYKQTGGPAQEDHPVSADPEFTTIKCDASDFVILVCDGISEGNFPNAEVIQLAAEELKTSDGRQPDLAAAAAAVCRQALKAGSMDNLSCMIVLFGGGEVPGPALTFEPGPYDVLDNAAFHKAYEAMAEHAGFSLAQAIEKRYDTACQERDGSAGAADVRQELSLYGDGPPAHLQPGSPDRLEWFVEFLKTHEAHEADNDPMERMMEALHSNPDMIQSDPQLLAIAQAQGLMQERVWTRVVRVAAAEELKKAVEAHPALKWTDKHAEACGKNGTVTQDDTSDGTAQVKFDAPMAFSAWLPCSTLMLVEDGDGRRIVKSGPAEEVKPAVLANASLQWSDGLIEFCGMRGAVLRDDDSDNTSQVKFTSAHKPIWLPTSVLQIIDRGNDADAEEAKRQRIS